MKKSIDLMEVIAIIKATSLNFELATLDKISRHRKDVDGLETACHFLKFGPVLQIIERTGNLQFLTTCYRENSVLEIN